jgi:hypothetical protein
MMREMPRVLPALGLAAAMFAAGPVAAAGDSAFGLPADMARQMSKNCAALFPNSNMQAACREAFDQWRSPYENTTQRYDPADEARKARRHVETGYHDPAAVELCPPPRRMTAEDGCK